jgi:anti-sigma regulatory factor (Ser/Thr protein kinase)
MSLQITADSEPIKMKIVIPTNVYFLSGVRQFTLDVAHNVAGFDQQWAHRLQSVVDEMINNAIEYGSAPGDEIEIELAVVRQKWVQVTVSDSGRGAANHTAAELREIAAAAKNNVGKPNLDLRGRGFQIMGGWSDAIDFTDNARGGLSVMIKKNYVPVEEPLRQIVTATGKNVYALNH